MRIRVWVEYPWAEVPDDVHIVEVVDAEWAAMSEAERDEFAEGAISELAWSRITGGWEELG